MRDVKENRSAGRYPTSCTIELESGTVGVTHNLSTTGVCFTMDQAIEPNKLLRCFIIMEKSSGTTARLRCEGRVVRTEKSTNGWEMALSFTTFEW